MGLQSSMDIAAVERCSARRVSLILGEKLAMVSFNSNFYYGESKKLTIAYR